MYGCRNWRGPWQNKKQGFTDHAPSQSASTGNRAFDEYREQTLRRLEEEQNEFHEFLARLRMAKDQAEFDQFMNTRSVPTSVPATGNAPQDSVQDLQS